jgi:hypothetical protein
MHISLHGPTVKAVVLGLVLGLAVTAISPSSSHAIPTAGDYIFTSGPTGTFTSTGTDLTAWSITDLFGKTWSNLDNSLTLQSNGPDFFQQTGDPSTLNGVPELLRIVWTDLTTQHAGKVGSGCCVATSPIPFTYTPVTAVPEPASLILVGLGFSLLALVRYLNRQRRQGGLQIG